MSYNILKLKRGKYIGLKESNFEMNRYVKNVLKKSENGLNASILSDKCEKAGMIR